MSTRTKAEAVVLLVLLVGLAVSGVRARRLSSALAGAQHERDSVLISNAAKQAQLDGWSTRFADSVHSIRDILAASKDSQVTRLAKSLGQSHARETELVEANATLRDSLTSVASRVDTVATGLRYSGKLADGLLSGTWAFLAPSLRLNYVASVPVQIVTSRGGDGRYLVTARATDPRATLDVTRTVINPPPPVVLRECTLRQSAWRVGLGLIAGYALRR